MAALFLVWGAALLVSALAYFLVARACGYDNSPVLAYAAYFALYIALPGVVCLSVVRGRALSVVEAVTLGVPTGYALEILGFLALSAAEAKAVYPFLPLAWGAWGMALVVRRRAWPLRGELPAHRAGVALALSLLVLATVVSAASQMFAEAPLENGLPAGEALHDWIYLVSRAATIKNVWPLQDPSLAGAPLQYHYFMLVHTAAASGITGVELSVLFLRLVVVPLGVVLVFQAYWLGRRLSRSPWGGVAAAVLTLIAAELSFSSNPMDPAYLGIFGRWLYQSPTFFFGMIFFGALLLSVDDCLALRACTWRHYAWLVLLAAAGTGAKGTILPTLLIALAALILWRWGQDRRMPRRLIALTVCLAGAFAVVYHFTMESWGTGEAVVAPFQTMRMSHFWRDFEPAGARWLTQWLPSTFSSNLTALVCVAIVFFGTAGFRAFALPYLFLPRWQRSPRLATWLGLVFASSYGLGVYLHLNSYSQLYFALLARLPLAVLAAAFLVAAARRIRYWARHGGWLRAPAGPRGLQPVPMWIGDFRRATVVLGAAGCATALLGAQVTHWAASNRAGFTRWLHASAPIEDNMEMLHQALLWVRANTESDAVLVSNTFTSQNLRRDRPVVVDHTLAGTYFYYSALSERRQWVEGPVYALDPAEAERRLRVAAEVFYAGGALPVDVLALATPCYLLLDRAVPDGARVTLPERSRVFANSRIEIYRLPRLALAGKSSDSLADSQP